MEPDKTLTRAEALIYCMDILKELSERDVNSIAKQLQVKNTFIDIASKLVNDGFAEMNEFNRKSEQERFIKGQVQLKIEKLPERKAERMLIGYTSEHFTMVKKLGAGSGGTVWQAINKETGQPCVLKICDMNARVNQCKKDVKILQHLNHPNVIKISDFYIEGDEYYIVMELCTGGDLVDNIKNVHNKLSPEQVVKYVLDIAKGIKYIHENGYNASRYKKEENILICTGPNGENVAKLTDFGLATSSPKSSNFMGTVLYMHPKLFKGEEYNRDVDVRTLGIIMYQLLIGRPEMFQLVKQENPSFVSDFVENILVPHYCGKRAKKANASEQEKVCVYKVKNLAFNVVHNIYPRLGNTLFGKIIDELLDPEHTPSIDHVINELQELLEYLKSETSSTTSGESEATEASNASSESEANETSVPEIKIGKTEEWNQLAENLEKMRIEAETNGEEGGAAAEGAEAVASDTKFPLDRNGLYALAKQYNLEYFENLAAKPIFNGAMTIINQPDESSRNRYILEIKKNAYNIYLWYGLDIETNSLIFRIIIYFNEVQIYDEEVYPEQVAILLQKAFEDPQKFVLLQIVD